MDATTELSLLESAYAKYVTTGVAEYSVNGREVRYHDVKWLVSRIDTLRAQIYRASNGMFAAAQFRKPE